MKDERTVAARFDALKLLVWTTLIGALLVDSRELRQYLGPIGKFIPEIPELLAGLVLAGTVLLAATRRRPLLIPARYLVVGLLFVLLVINGAVYNDVSEGTVFAGIRIYFRYLPLFFVPLILPFSDAELTRLMKVMLAIMMMQVPIAFAQRLAFPDAATGDMVRGTFGSGAIMSISLVATITVLFAFHLRGRIRLIPFLILAAILALPTLINETKGTVLLLPLALAAVAWFSHRGTARMGRVARVVCLATLFVGAFATVYDSMYADMGAGRHGFFNYLLEGGAVETVYKGPDAAEEGSVGRIDSILIAFEELGDDVGKLAFGLGVGNRSNPTGTELLRGAYAVQYDKYGGTTVAGILWELGLVGLTLGYLTLFLLFRDARTLASSSGFIGALGLAWLGVVVLVSVAMLYKNMLHHGTIAFPFMFFSGVVLERLTAAARTAREPITALTTQAAQRH